MRKTKKKLLVVDDEPIIKLLVKKTFEHEYVVLEAENGKEAIDLALQHIPSVILMDIMMPNVDGLTALNTLKNDKHTRSIPIIMLTGVGHELNEEHARSLGALTFLRKPVTSRELLDAVSKTI